jgi:hypothetical protein
MGYPDVEQKIRVRGWSLRGPVLPPNGTSCSWSITNGEAGKRVVTTIDSEKRMIQSDGNMWQKPRWRKKTCKRDMQKVKRMKMTVTCRKKGDAQGILVITIECWSWEPCDNKEGRREDWHCETLYNGDLKKSGIKCWMVTLGKGWGNVWQHSVTHTKKGRPNSDYKLKGKRVSTKGGERVITKSDLRNVWLQVTEGNAW